MKNSRCVSWLLHPNSDHTEDLSWQLPALGSCNRQVKILTLGVVLGLTQLVVGSCPLRVMHNWLEASRGVCLCVYHLPDSPLQGVSCAQEPLADLRGVPTE